LTIFSFIPIAYASSPTPSIGETEMANKLAPGTGSLPTDPRRLVSSRKKTISEKRAEQATYQREYRARQKRARAPSRDDIARQALHWMVMEAIGKGKRDNLDWAQGRIIKCLVTRGFDEDACWQAFDDIIEKYAGGWTFQRKPQWTAEND
jgi:hypothetical protein